MSAAEKIKAACECPDAEVKFLAGGTQTNVIVIDSMLRKYEGVIAAETGHVSVHEAGAVEASGHKVLTVPHRDGKLSACDVDSMIADFYADENHEHMVFPGMVYVSHPTEYGTLYTKSELEEIADVCHKWNIPLYLDGARLAYALASKDTDLTLSDIARICDVFYIGGTKCGALCGEAVVFTKNNIPQHFVTEIKRHLALGAKGRLTGIQFDALFTDGLYFRIGRRAIDTAMRMKEIMEEKGYRLYLDSPTNQQFFIIENSKVEELYSKVACGFMDKYDDEHAIIRLCTSWATDMQSVEALREIM
jgi:threonine aldolase